MVFPYLVVLIDGWMKTVFIFVNYIIPEYNISLNFHIRLMDSFFARICNLV
jgi:hypothetical protein